MSIQVAGTNQISPTGFSLVQLKKYRDDRGYFLQGLSPIEYFSLAVNTFMARPLIENVSLSHKNVFRGFHYQEPRQNKLIKVLHGAILDIAICLDEGEFFMHAFSCVLSAEHDEALWIPENHAHGFLALEPNTIISYTVDAPYSPSGSKYINYRDPAIKGLEWNKNLPLDDFILSEKDKNSPFLSL